MNAHELTTRAIQVLQQRYIGRRDVWAEQLSTGQYRAHRQPLCDQTLIDHIHGQRVVGVYQLDPANLVKWLLLDLDLQESEASCHEHIDDFTDYLNRLELEAANFGLQGLREFSGRKGFHMVYFLDEPVQASYARAVGQKLLEQAGAPAGPISVELFPKQTALTPQMPLGNLVKLVWAKHRRGDRSIWVDANLESVGDWFEGQLRYLEAAPLNRADHICTLANTICQQDVRSSEQMIASPLAHDSEKPWRHVLDILQRDPMIRDLYRGEPFKLTRYASRSEAEFALVIRLMEYEVPPAQINELMYTAGIGKWRDAGEHYRRQTLHKAALQRCQQVDAKS